MSKSDESIHIRLQDLHSGLNAADILVCIYLKANERNRYPIGYYITDNDGVVHIEKHDLLRSVNAVITETPMDYAPGWEDCDQLVIDILTSQQIRQRLKVLRDTYPERAEDLQKLSQRALNGCLESSFSFGAKIGEPIEFRVRLKPVKKFSL